MLSVHGVRPVFISLSSSPTKSSVRPRRRRPCMIVITVITHNYGHKRTDGRRHAAPPPSVRAGERNEPSPSRRVMLHDMSAAEACGGGGGGGGDMGGYECAWCKSDKPDDQGTMRRGSRPGDSVCRDHQRPRPWRRRVSACDPGAREPNLTLGLGRVPRGHVSCFTRKNRGRVLAKKPGPRVKPRSPRSRSRSVTVHVRR